MPLYEYICSDCTRPFDLLVSSPALADRVVCRYCGGDRVRRLISLVAAHVSSSSVGEGYAATPSSGGGCGCGGHCACGGH